jgi:hypothetical protein
LRDKVDVAANRWGPRVFRVLAEGVIEMDIRVAIAVSASILTAIIIILMIIFLVRELDRAKRREREEKEREEQEKKWKEIIAIGSKRAEQAREAEKAEIQQAIQNVFRQLQVNAKALESEMQALQRANNFLLDRGVKIPQQVELLYQKRQLEKKIVELQMQGVSEENLYNDIRLSIEHVENKLAILRQGEITELLIERQGGIRSCLQRIAWEHAIVGEKLKRKLASQFTPDEVQNILAGVSGVLDELVAMIAAAEEEDTPTSSKSR